MYPYAPFYDPFLVLINDTDVHLNDVKTLALGSYVCETIILAFLILLITNSMGVFSPDFFPQKKKHSDTVNQKYF